MATEREAWIDEQGEAFGREDVVTVNVFDGEGTVAYADIHIGEPAGTPEHASTPVSVHNGIRWVRIGDAETGTSEEEWLENIAELVEREYERAMP